VLIEESYDDDLALVDVRLAARLYPLGCDRDVRPHVGAGLGYFWFLDRYEYEYAQTFEDPLFPGTFYTVVDKEEGTDTVAHGFFPFVTAGLAIALTDNAELLFDFQYDFDKENQGIDLSGPIYMLGARFRF
jgi:outer membrane protein W